MIVPAGSEWVAFQLESEGDQDGESGSWSGASFLYGELPVCGDGILDPGEECDDGNTNDGDGCSSDCQSSEVCGNGVLDSDLGPDADSDWVVTMVGRDRMRWDGTVGGAAEQQSQWPVE